MHGGHMTIDFIARAIRLNRLRQNQQIFAYIVNDELLSLHPEIMSKVTYFYQRIQRMENTFLLLFVIIK